MRIKISEATPRQLDYLAAKCEGRLKFALDLSYSYLCALDYAGRPFALDYTTNWALGGPIIERELVEITPDESDSVVIWYSEKWPDYSKPCSGRGSGSGPTPLIAAMRCYVASKLGDEAEIPEEL